MNLIKKTILVLSCLIMAACSNQSNNAAEQAAYDVIHRFAEQDLNIKLCADLPKTDDGCDQFTTSVNNGRLTIHGSSGIALCRGFYDYVKSQEAGISSWSGKRCELPERLTDTDEKHIISPFAHHYYFNVVTYGYTMPYWDWNRWEAEIDWMALHGVDMPLALVANEAISTRVWKKIGLTDEEISQYFVGPAHLPWMRMGNISGIDGPLDEAWHNDQIELQHKILDRMRALGMTPICPGFAGFVPEAIHRIYPETPLTETFWCDGQFHNWMLSPNDSLFSKIGKMFIEEWEQEFGPNTYYIIDSFNEMETPFPPKGSDERYELLASYGEQVYKSLTAGNPDAVWVMQGWMLGYQRDVWDQQTLSALFSRVPDDKMIILDLAVDYNQNFWHNSKNWNEFDSFYGKQWIYSVIPNMGGKTAPTGVMEHYANGRLEALNSPKRGHLVGYGMAPEGLENNEILYELITDGGWTADSIDLTAWLEQYCKCRYGQDCTTAQQFWNEAQQSIYSHFTDHPRFNWQQRPGLYRQGTVGYDSTFLKAVEKLQNGAENMKGNKLFETDLAEMTVMYAGAYAERLTQHIEDLMIEKDKNRDSITDCMQQFENLMLNIDMLLENHPTLRLEHWLDYPHLHDNGDAERGERFEHNARRIVTIWGPPVDDYSARIWSGLVRDYYLSRWMFYFDAKLNDKPFDFVEWERQWVEEKTGVSAIERNDDVVGLCKETVVFCKNLPISLLVSQSAR